MKILSFIVATALSAAAFSATAANDATFGKWTISFDESSRKVSFIKNGETVLSGVSVKYKLNGSMVDTSTYTETTVTQEDATDAVGACKKVTFSHTKAGSPTVDQTFLLFDNKDYFLTEATVKSPNRVSTNMILPVATYSDNKFLPADANNRMLVVPFDNDGFVTYRSLPLSRANDPGSNAQGRYARDSISFEVTAIFNGETQQGLVLGSVEHDNWKSAIRMTGSPVTQGKMKRIECISGFADEKTHDVREHGYISGTAVKSARFMVGLYDDWRTGLETFGDVNAVYAPKRKWDGPTPFGWNSWGGMSTNVNYEGVMSVSDNIHKDFQGKGHFAEDGLCFVGLDSFWGNLNWDQLQEFADKCVANGQTPGIYWLPWNDFIWGENNLMEGNNGYYYRDNYLRVNGQVLSLCGAACMDPTAPGTISRLNYYIDRFKAIGFKYIKLDFMTNGIVEADSYYRKEITTGVQAYNYGMQKLVERCGDDMFIVLSISPLFPANYANARRISCDAWGEMWHTNYMMNSQSFGWWLSRVYSYNDPDHLCMGNRSDGENMSRVTTAAVTGYCMLGDNLSTEGSYIGDPGSQVKARKYFTEYPEVMDVVRLGKSFRPAYGHKIYGANGSVDQFTLDHDDAYYIAQFNYSEGTKTVNFDLTKLGFDVSKIDTSAVKELWTAKNLTITDGVITLTLGNDRPALIKLPKKK